MMALALMALVGLVDLVGLVALMALMTMVAMMALVNLVSMVALNHQIHQNHQQRLLGLVVSSDRSSYCDGGLLWYNKIRSNSHFLKFRAFLPIYLVCLLAN